VLTAELEEPRGYGRIVRDASGGVEAIVEQGALPPEQAGLREVNSGTYVFNRAKLAGVLGKLGRDNVHREYYLTDAIKLLRQGGESVAAHVAREAEEILGSIPRRSSPAWTPCCAGAKPRR